MNFFIQGITSGCVTCVAFLTVFLVVKLFPTVVQVWGAAATYFGFGGVCFVMALFTILFVPETQGKTMAEIQMLFGQNKEKE